MTTDIHAHVTTDPAAQLKRAREAGADRTVLLSARQDPEKPRTLKGMRAERSGLNRVISGAAPPGESFRSAAAELLAALDAYPGETLGFASVRPGQDAESAAARLGPCLSRPDIRGTGELTPAPDKAALIEPAPAVSADRGGLPVLVHGHAPSTASDIRAYAGLTARCQGVPLIAGAPGGLNWTELTDPASEHPNLCIDLASATTVFAARTAALTVPRQCLPGSNTPCGDVAATRTVLEIAVTDPAILRQVLHDNPARLSLG